ncbi:hypothetical protein [Chromatium okenii]|nr:hypothetical protein [Chromatium okenii]
MGEKSRCAENGANEALSVMDGMLNDSLEQWRRKAQRRPRVPS